MTYILSFDVFLEKFALSSAIVDCPESLYKNVLKTGDNRLRNVEDLRLLTTVYFMYENEKIKTCEKSRNALLGNEQDMDNLLIANDFKAEDYKYLKPVWH